MFGKLWNLLFLAGLAATAYSAITGKDITGAPTSVATTECGDIADQFIGEGLSADYTLRTIQRIDRLEVLTSEDTYLLCRGLANLEGSPSTFVRLTATTDANGQGYLEIKQARPEDYDCGILAEEIAMKYSAQEFGVFGRIMKISDGQPIPNRAAISCQGKALFTSGVTLPLTYAYDGERFFANP